MYKNSAFILAGSSCPEKSLNAIVSDKLMFFLLGFVTYIYKSSDGIKQAAIWIKNASDCEAVVAVDITLNFLLFVFEMYLRRMAQHIVRCS